MGACTRVGARTRVGACAQREGCGRRAALQVRTWLTALLRLSLCMGSLVDGVFQHDIVRDYAISRCTDLQARQVRFIEALIDKRLRPEEGWPTIDVTERG